MRRFSGCHLCHLRGRHRLPVRNVVAACESTQRAHRLTAGHVVRPLAINLTPAVRRLAIGLAPLKLHVKWKTINNRSTAFAGGHPVTVRARVGSRVRSQARPTVPAGSRLSGAE